jgi:hypothetical protein
VAQARRHQHGVSGVQLDRHASVVALDEQPTVFAVPVAQRDADDPEVAAALGPIGLAVDMEGDLWLGPDVRELQDDLWVAHPARAPLLGQLLGEPRDLVAPDEMREPVRAPQPLAQLGCAGPALEQVDVKEP